jgi:hypothetical protein
MASVVISPPKGLGEIYEDNRAWATQYVSASPRTRFQVQLEACTPEAVLKATRQAVAKATNSGEVIYAVGHGGTGEGSTSGQADFAPQKGFRVSQFLAYYDDATSTWKGKSIHDMQDELTKIKLMPDQKRKKQEKAWCGRYIRTFCEMAKEQTIELKTLQPYYLELGKIFRATPVRRIVLLTCNVANAPDFLDELATDLGVPVTAYTERVMSRRKIKGGVRHVWMFLAGDERNESDTELLPGVSQSKVMTGRVRASVDSGAPR